MTDVALKDFVRQTLIDVIEGGYQARLDLDADKAPDGCSKGIVNPIFGKAENVTKEDIYRMEFDVAVTVSETTSKDLKAGLQITVLSAGAEKTAQIAQSSVSHVKFVVPYLLGITAVTNAKES